MRRVGYCNVSERSAYVLKALLQEISEDYLGVAPIRSGDPVIIYEWSAVWHDS